MQIKKKGEEVVTTIGHFLLFNFCFFCYDGDVTDGAIDGVLTFGYREMNQTLSGTLR
jgi:hypothetical protein